MKDTEHIEIISSVSGAPTSNCLASNSYYSFDAHGNRKTFTDKNGNVTETLHNSRGLVETERSGLKWQGGTVFQAKPAIQQHAVMVSSINTLVPVLRV